MRLVPFDVQHVKSMTAWNNSKERLKMTTHVAPQYPTGPGHCEVVVAPSPLKLQIDSFVSISVSAKESPIQDCAKEQRSKVPGGRDSVRFVVT